RALEEGPAALLPADYLQEPPPAGAQVAATYLPHPRTATAFPWGPFCVHRPRSVCCLSLHGELMEVALQAARAAKADLPRAGENRRRGWLEPAQAAGRNA